MDERTIISIAEFRKISGLSPAVITDDQVVEVIQRLDTMAQIYIRQSADRPRKDNDEG